MAVRSRMRCSNAPFGAVGPVAAGARARGDGHPAAAGVVRDAHEQIAQLGPLLRVRPGEGAIEVVRDDEHAVPGSRELQRLPELGRILRHPAHLGVHGGGEHGERGGASGAGGPEHDQRAASPRVDRRAVRAVADRAGRRRR